MYTKIDLRFYNLKKCQFFICFVIFLQIFFSIFFSKVSQPSRLCVHNAPISHCRVIRLSESGLEGGPLHTVCYDVCPGLLSWMYLDSDLVCVFDNQQLYLAKRCRRLHLQHEGLFFVHLNQ